MVDRSIKAGATAPSLRMTLKDGATAQDVSTATAITLDMMDDNKTALKITAGSCSLVNDGTDGLVEYAWQAGDTDTPGLYLVEVNVTWADSSVTKFPDSGYGVVEVTETI